MKRYCGCISPTERRVETVWRWGTNSRKKIAAFFLSCCFFLCCEVSVERRKEAFLPTTDWNSRTKQRERPKWDRLIARDVKRNCLKEWYTYFTLSELLQLFDYKNHKISLPWGGIFPLSKCGAISATISGYLMVMGTFCCLNDFQYNLLNWYTCSISFLISKLSKFSSLLGDEIFSFIGKG